MSRPSPRLALAVLASLIALSRPAAAQPRDTTAKVVAPAKTAAPLSWMAGCWEQRTPRRTVQELWLPPAGGMLQGMGRTLRRSANGAEGDSVAEFEFLRIVERAGARVYLAQPNGQPPTEFTTRATLSAGDTSVTF